MEGKSKVINFRREKFKHDVKVLLNYMKQVFNYIFNRGNKTAAYYKSSKGYKKMQGKRKI